MDKVVRLCWGAKLGTLPLLIFHNEFRGQGQFYPHSCAFPVIISTANLDIEIVYESKLKTGLKIGRQLCL